MSSGVREEFAEHTRLHCRDLFLDGGLVPLVWCGLVVVHKLVELEASFLRCTLVLGSEDMSGIVAE